MPTRGNGTQLSVRMPVYRAAKWSSLENQRLADGVIEDARLVVLIGRLPFASSAVSGRFARTLMGPAYRKLRAMPYIASLAADEGIICRVRGNCLARAVDTTDPPLFISPRLRAVYRRIAEGRERSLIRFSTPNRFDGLFSC